MEQPDEAESPWSALMSKGTAETGASCRERLKLGSEGGDVQPTRSRYISLGTSCALDYPGVVYLVECRPSPPPALRASGISQSIQSTSLNGAVAPGLLICACSPQCLRSTCLHPGIGGVRSSVRAGALYFLPLAQISAIPLVVPSSTSHSGTLVYESSHPA